VTRILDQFSYGDGPIAACFWNETSAPQNWPALGTEVTAEVAIIGGGYTGLTAGLLLAEAGRDVVVLDAQQPGWGASGRNGGFCCLGGAKASDKAMQRRFGQENLRDYRLAERDAVDFVAAQLERLNIDADVHSDGETMVAHRPRDIATLESEAAHLDAIYGVRSDIISADDMAAHGMRGGFHGAWTNPIGFALNPRKYVIGLAGAADKAGVQIFGDSAVLDAAATPQGYRLRTKTGTVLAKQVIIATNGYSSETIPKWMAGRYMPVQSNVMVTRVLTQNEQAAQGWTSTQMAHDTRNLLHYFRLMPDGRFLFGMRGGLRSNERAFHSMRATIRRHFDQLFPAWAEVDAPWFWSGHVCMTRGLTPYVGEIPDQPGMFAGFAYHGNGVAMGSYSGALLADRVLNQQTHRHPLIMQSKPGFMPGGRLRKLALWPAYLGYGLQDL
jgi:glycine/D-amino acid oxidase-like deaminating enzyme